MSNGHQTAVEAGLAGSGPAIGAVVRVTTAAGITRAEATAAQGELGKVTGISGAGFYCVEFTDAGGGSWVASAVRPDEITEATG